MKKSNLKRLGGLLLILLVISTGCDKKENEVETYEKSDNNIIEQSKDKNKNNEDETKSNISSIQLENGENLLVVKGYDEDNNMVWSYSTKSSYNDSLNNYFEGKDNIYVNDGGSLVALDKETGTKLWTKTDCKVSDFSDSVEIEDSLYLVADGPEYQLLVIDIADGETIKQLDTKVKVQEKSANERYKTYLANLEKGVKATCTTNHPCVELDGNSLKFRVELKGNLDLYVRYQNDEKEIEKLVAKNVVQFYILENGNSGEKSIYYITKDGSIYVADDFMYVTSPEKVKSTKLNYKNIVSMQPAETKPQQYGGGATKPYFIDIDGNIYK